MHSVQRMESNKHLRLSQSPFGCFLSEVSCHNLSRPIHDNHIKYRKLSQCLRLRKAQGDQGCCQIGHSAPPYSSSCRPLPRHLHTVRGSRQRFVGGSCRGEHVPGQATAWPSLMMCTSPCGWENPRNWPGSVGIGSLSMFTREKSVTYKPNPSCKFLLYYMANGRAYLLVEELGELGRADARRAIRDALDRDVGRQVQAHHQCVELCDRAAERVPDLRAHISGSGARGGGRGRTRTTCLLPFSAMIRCVSLRIAVAVS